MKSSGNSFKSRILEIVYRYRTKPAPNNMTPAELYLGRNIRNSFDALRPPKILCSKGTVNPRDTHLKVQKLSLEEKVQALARQHRSLANSIILFMQTMDTIKETHLHTTSLPCIIATSRHQEPEHRRNISGLENRFPTLWRGEVEP